MASSITLPNGAFNRLFANRLIAISLRTNKLNVENEIITANNVNEELFKYGVASGDPYQNSVIIWSKLDYDELSKLGLLNDNLDVQYFVSLNEDFSEVLQTNTFSASVENDFTIKLIVENLEPDTYYYYKFRFNNYESINGRTRTLPMNANEMKMNFTSCTNVQQGKDNTYRKMLEEAEEEEHNLWCHLGDYIYDSEFPLSFQPGTNLFTGEQYEQGVRPENIPALNIPTTPSGLISAVFVEDYRNLWKQYYNFLPYLRKLLSRFPLLWINDDHEFTNNYRGIDPEADATYANPNPNVTLFQRKMNAYKVLKEFLPIGRRGLSINNSDGLFNVNRFTSFYTSRNFADIAKWIILDNRSLSTGPYITPSTFFDYDRLKTLEPSDAFQYVYDNYDSFLEALKNPDRNILGPQQEEWLKNEIENTTLENVVFMNSNVTNTLYENKAFSIAFDLVGEGVYSSATDVIGNPIVQQQLAAVFLGPEVTAGEVAPALTSDNIGNGFPVSRERIHNLIKNNNKKVLYLAGDIHECNVWKSEYPEFVTTSCSAGGFDRFFYTTRSIIQNVAGKEPIQAQKDYFGKSLNINGRIFSDAFNRGYNKITLSRNNVLLTRFGGQIYNQDPPWEHFTSELPTTYITNNFIYENWETVREV
jgi:phosphodiesterase/alkaline phosphatase D-like protein